MIKIGLGLGTAALALCACAAVLGIEDGHPRVDEDDTGAPPVDSGPAVIVGDGAIAQGESGTPSDGCEDIAIDDTSGIFVTTEGTDDASCGARTSPCKSVQRGIARVGELRGAGKTTVFVASGTYVEALTLGAGVTVFGGFSVLANGGTPQWSRVCSNAATIIKAPAGATITARADRIGGPAKLSTLSLESEDAKDVKAGESLYGVLVTGQTTALTMVAVTVSTENGGDGEPGVLGDAGAPGRNDCDAGGDAAPGAPSGATGPGADAGYFAVTGYVATGGGSGNAGPSGNNGTAAGAGICQHCVDCSGLVACSSDAGLLCGSAGTVGCGGPGGAGGTGGSGGGSSIPLFVWDGAHASVTAGKLSAGSGGRGGAGGAGGNGGPGGTGKAGATTTSTCALTCSALTCGTASSGAGQGGTAGGTGGAGAAGGTGGDGSGGDSFAYVVSRDSNVTFGSVAPDLAHGSGGSTVGNGAAGRSADKGP